LKFLRFQGVKNKARDIRLFHIWCPTTPKERFPEAFPYGFYAAFGVKTVQKYSFSPKLQIIGEEIHFNGAHFFKKRKCENANITSKRGQTEARFMFAERE